MAKIKDNPYLKAIIDNIDNIETVRKVVEKNYNGPAGVTGGAGTGKTVVAIHRAKHLSNMLEPEKRILFTTFTANLASDIEENLKKICTVQEMRNIDVMHLDSWVARFLKANGYNYTIDYDRIDNVWEQAYINSGESLDFDYTLLRKSILKLLYVKTRYLCQLI